MSVHTLLGRTEDELLWFRRRGFLQAAAAWTAAGGFTAAEAWGRGSPRQIVTPTLTAGIRGTGVYTEIFADQDQRSYFCNCYGTVELAAGGERTVSRSDYHQSFWGEVAPKNGRLLTPANAINHTDEELELLAGLIGQRTAWQIAGRRGVKDGAGYMDPGQPHPLMQTR
jgi:hypothetical protein